MFSVININDGSIKKIKTTKERHQTEKKLLYIEKLRDSFIVELEKIKKQVDSISFKNTECCTFEDVRDIQLSNQNKNDIYESGRGKIKKISLEGVFNRCKSSCYIFPKVNNTEKKIIQKNNQKKMETKNESIPTELFDNEEENRMIDRLNIAYKKYEKKYNNDRNKIKSDKNTIVKNLLLSYE